ncbi:unnamed protein product [Mytilus coruscus]|uniref:EF-hand domain-containing protein n=1 Tax=Mytilus coruscus TaxID=42192 RepID=A0A6J8BR65_MYTCO|nr:unnamed protein product [Mytilus coruscus]
MLHYRKECRDEECVRGATTQVADVLFQNSAKRQTPYSAVSDGTNGTPQTDVFTKEYEADTHLLNDNSEMSTQILEPCIDGYLWTVHNIRQLTKEILSPTIVGTMQQDIQWCMIIKPSGTTGHSKNYQLSAKLLSCSNYSQINSTIESSLINCNLEKIMTKKTLRSSPFALFHEDTVVTVNRFFQRRLNSSVLLNDTLTVYFKIDIHRLTSANEFFVSQTNSHSLTDLDRMDSDTRDDLFFYRQVFELCANASTSTKDLKPDSYISQLLKTDNIHETTETEEKMSTKDLKIVFNQLGFNTTEAEIGMLLKNSSISGKCTLVDVIKMLKHEDFAESDLSEDRQELWETFKYFDKDCDGFITISDLQDAMECLSLDVKPSEVYQMVLGADLNGDHRVGFEEFETMLKDDDHDS